ncbi:hypothetical protein D3C87_1169150 [compost metagenome]
MIEQLVNGASHRVRHVFSHTVGIEADLLGHGLTLGILLFVGLDDDPPRNTHHSGTRRHFLGHDGIGTHLGPGTDSERAQHLRARPDHDAITQGRVTLALVPAGAAQGHALINSHVIADFGGFTDNDAHAMVNEETTTDLGTRMDLDPGQPAAEIRHQPRQPFQVRAPQHRRQTVNPDGVHAGVASQDFKSVTRRRVTMENTLDIFTQTLKHH